MFLDKIFDLFKPKLQYTNKPIPFNNNIGQTRYMTPDTASEWLRKAYECAEIINKTTNVETFFKRLSVLLSTLTVLSNFEGKINFKNGLPSDDLKKIISNLENTVNDFIDRSYNAELEKIVILKTYKAKSNRAVCFFSKLEYAFEFVDDFRDAYNNYYNGPLYTENNINRVKDLYKATLNTHIGNC